MKREITRHFSVMPYKAKREVNSKVNDNLFKEIISLIFHCT